MKLVSPDSWMPRGVSSLETSADYVVKSLCNTIVSAGPGAGKTELLAQRACYLLETGVCPNPRRILSISFKRDAAKNLKDRVAKRCDAYSSRFDSFTLDAFAKSIVDRFLPSLVSEWRPRTGYEIAVKGMRVDDMREWLRNAGFPGDETKVLPENVSDQKIRQCFDLMAHGQVFPYTDSGIHAVMRHWGLQWWKRQLALPEGIPSLTFPMLNRLAAFLLRDNTKITRALRATYAFVFIDEFQDTTEAQYDLIRAAFHDSLTTITAVGDEKQRIMLWAGAKCDIFEIYKTDFSAETLSLLRNYRSLPELVRMQHVIAQAVETGTPASVSAKTETNGGCSILAFSNPEQEAEYLSGLIENAIITEGKNARDFCVLSRQRTGVMITSLQRSLAKKGIKIRDESALQDLLIEPVVQFLLSILQLATRPRDPDAWDLLTKEISRLLGLDGQSDNNEIERVASRLLNRARDLMINCESISVLLQPLLTIIGADKFRALYRQYGNGSYLADVVRSLEDYLKTTEMETLCPRETVDAFVGIDIIPAMTIHKSKGLEFHTVIFIGLEDSQWWSFSSQADEEKRSFFVAFSRAIEQVFFTFADVREERWGRRQQSVQNIGDLYAILQKAGVPINDCRSFRIKN